MVPVEEHAQDDVTEYLLHLTVLVESFPAPASMLVLKVFVCTRPSSGC